MLLILLAMGCDSAWGPHVTAPGCALEVVEPDLGRDEASRIGVTPGEVLDGLTAPGPWRVTPEPRHELGDPVDVELSWSLTLLDAATVRTVTNPDPSAIGECDEAGHEELALLVHGGVAAPGWFEALGTTVLLADADGRVVESTTGLSTLPDDTIAEPVKWSIGPSCDPEQIVGSLYLDHDSLWVGFLECGIRSGGDLLEAERLP